MVKDNSQYQGVVMPVRTVRDAYIFLRHLRDETNFCWFENSGQYGYFIENKENFEDQVSYIKGYNDLYYVTDSEYVAPTLVEHGVSPTIFGPRPWRVINDLSDGLVWSLAVAFFFNVDFFIIPHAHNKFSFKEFADKVVTEKSWSEYEDMQLGRSVFFSIFDFYVIASNASRHYEKSLILLSKDQEILNQFKSKSGLEIMVPYVQEDHFDVY